CKNEYKYTPKGEGVQILKEGPIQLSSAKPAEPATATDARKKQPTPVEKQPEKKDDECPEEMAKVNASGIAPYCIDRWEIHLVNDNGEIHPKDRIPGEMTGWKAVSASGVYPQGFFTQPQAKAACEAAGKYLCSQKQFKTACKGPNGTKFPYGETYQEGICNVGQKNTIGPDGRVILPEKPHILDIIDPPPENAMHGVYKAHHNARTRIFYDVRAAQVEGYLMPAGSFPKCVVVWNGREVYDMEGNLSELTGTTRGGNISFVGDGHSGTDMAGCDRSPFAHDDRWRDYSLGARCCKKL
ncbi:hypothetical protein JXA56_04030, partial [Candidatus Micrarchaeota archaeon]|nr:hypothetical protein [Candidatus Micrarchaeota archaeon]